MLSAAHVLAMDAKNLLDVVDSVRIRYPDLFSVEHSSTTAVESSKPSTIFYFTKDQGRSYVEGNSENASNLTASINIDSDSDVQQTYQNLSKSKEVPQPSPTTLDGTYINQERIESVNKTERIYDNECIESGQLKNRNNLTSLASTAINQSNRIDSLASAKPPVAAKPGKHIPLYVDIKKYIHIL